MLFRLAIAPKVDLRAVEIKAVMCLMDDVVKSYSHIQTMVEGMGDAQIVLQGFNAKVVKSTDTFNRVLLEALQAAAESGANLGAAQQTVQDRAREMVRANVNQTLHQGKIALQRTPVSFHEGHVDEIQQEIRNLL